MCSVGGNLVGVSGVVCVVSVGYSRLVVSWWIFFVSIGVFFFVGGDGCRVSLCWILVWLLS